jgi:hypothetical protein
MSLGQMIPHVACLTLKNFDEYGPSLLVSVLSLESTGSGFDGVFGATARSSNFFILASCCKSSLSFSRNMDCRTRASNSFKNCSSWLLLVLPLPLVIQVAPQNLSLSEHIEEDENPLVGSKTKHIKMRTSAKIHETIDIDVIIIADFIDVVPMKKMPCFDGQLKRMINNFV